MHKGPRLAIGLPVYNGERYLEEAMHSLLGQTYRDFEIVVCDNASSDRTPQIVAALARQDGRVRYVRNDRNIGASPNFARVAQLTSAPLFKWAAHDDLYDPTYLEACIGVLDAHPDVVLAHSDTRLIDGCGQSFPPTGRPGTYVDAVSGGTLTVDPNDLAEAGGPLRRFHDVVFRSRIGTHMFGVMRRSALEGTRSIQNIPSSDRPFLAELALLGPFGHVRQPLFAKRFHEAMAWALGGTHVRTYVSGNAARYYPLARQLRVYLTAPAGKPVGLATKAGCCGVVLAYSAKVLARKLSRRRRHPASAPLVADASMTGPTADQPGKKEFKAS